MNVFSFSIFFSLNDRGFYRVSIKKMRHSFDLISPASSIFVARDIEQKLRCIFLWTPCNDFLESSIFKFQRLTWHQNGVELCQQFLIYDMTWSLLCLDLSDIFSLDGRKLFCREVAHMTKKFMFNKGLFIYYIILFWLHLDPRPPSIILRHNLAFKKIKSQD